MTGEGNQTMFRVKKRLLFLLNEQAMLRSSGCLVSLPEVWMLLLREDSKLAIHTIFICCFFLANVRKPFSIFC